MEKIISLYPHDILKGELIIGIAETVLTELTSGKEFPQRYLFTKVSGGYRGYNIDFMIRVESTIAELKEESAGDDIKDILDFMSEELFESTLATIDIHDQYYSDTYKNIVEYSDDELWLAYAKIRLNFSNTELALLLNHHEEPEFIQWKKEFKKIVDTLNIPQSPNLKFRANDINFIILATANRQLHSRDRSREAPWPVTEIITGAGHK
jgi:hypothetical protein